jgi:3-phytase
VTAAGETAPLSRGSADDTAIWVHPDDPAQSLIFAVGTSGLRSYRLDGALHAVHSDETFRNIDVLPDGFMLNGRSVPLVAATNAQDRGLSLFAFDSATGSMTLVGFRRVSGRGNVSGVATYRSAISGNAYAFVNSAAGLVKQYQMNATADRVGFTLVREFNVGSQTEGMVVDADHGALYVSEENVGIWSYGAEPTAGSARVLVDGRDDGNIVGDAEGLAIYSGANGAGYLVASSQGSDDFVVYDRVTNEYVGRFSVSAGSIDGVGGSDGISISSAALGNGREDGLLVVSDERDNAGGAARNFKLVSWAEIELEVLAA